MNKKLTLTRYSPLEEKINYISHGLGFLLSIPAAFALIQKSLLFHNSFYLGSAIIYGLSLIILFAASTCYHFTQEETRRYKFKVIDHAAIYIIIAGSYTPLTLITLQGDLGTRIFIAVWVFAIIGVTLKLFFTGRFKLVSTSMYVLMGWMIVLFIKPLSQVLSSDGIYWLMMGGAAYTIGAVIYSIKKIKFNHAIFHVFVLIGSGCIFVTIYSHIFII